MVALLYFGAYVEALTNIGRRYLLAIFLFSGIIGSVTCMVLGWKAIGASDAISGLFAPLILLEPNAFATIIDRESFWFAAIIWIILGFVLVGPVHIIHLTGLGAGLLLTFYWKKTKTEGFY